MAAVWHMAFQAHFLNENFSLSTKISLKYVPWCLTDNMSALAQIMAWRRSGDKPLSDPMVSQFSDTYIRHPDLMS